MRYFQSSPGTISMFPQSPAHLLTHWLGCSPVENGWLFRRWLALQCVSYDERRGRRLMHPPCHCQRTTGLVVAKVRLEKSASLSWDDQEGRMRRESLPEHRVWAAIEELEVQHVRRDRRTQSCTEASQAMTEYHQDDCMQPSDGELGHEQRCCKMDRGHMRRDPSTGLQWGESASKNLDC